MSRTATYEDANLILRLYEMRREDRMRAARAWFVASCHVRSPEELLALAPPGSEANASFRMVTSYWEMVASFITRGVLDPELFFQSGQEIVLVWERIKDLVPISRANNKGPHLFRNLETVANDFIAYWEAHSPGFYKCFSERVRTLPLPKPEPAPTETA